MAIEIERKFLVQGEQWRNLGKGKIYRQGYFPTTQGCTIRVRIIGDQGYLTIKGKTFGHSRSEFEYPIPVADAQEMLTTLCDHPLIEKTRYKITLDHLIWEVDEFMGDNQGLIIAEVELTSEDQKINLPEWIAQEVTGDPRYYNVNLTKYPFSQWGQTLDLSKE